MADKDTAEEELEAPGWNAIDESLRPIYEDQQPKHYGTLVGYELGGPDPIRGISAYLRLDPVPHWHFVTYGFSELYAKESENKDVSGWGFELTMRLSTSPDAEEPPMWTLNFLQNLARYVFQSGNVFVNGDYLNANGPIAAEADTALCAVVFVHDPELPSKDTPNGRLEFLQVVGITAEEEMAVKQWKTLKVLEVYKPYLPLFVTDLGRSSLMKLPGVAAQIAAGASQEGSFTGHIFVDQLAWEEKKRLLRKPLLSVELGARQITELMGLLPYRLGFGKEFALVGNKARVVFRPAETNTYEIDGTAVRIGLTKQALDEFLVKLVRREGIYELDEFPGLAFQVRKTHIRDSRGNIVETIG